MRSATVQFRAMSVVKTICSWFTSVCAIIINRRLRLARAWSNRELRKIAPLFSGSVVNVSAWDDRDKEGAVYKDYFIGASTYSRTNYVGFKGYEGKENEYLLDLTADIQEEMQERFDVVFNHTTLEHIFDIRRAFGNLCSLSKDVVLVVVPFSQAQHESGDWKDYWRFTPTCLRELFQENNLSVVYEAASPHPSAPVYILSVASRHPERWRDVVPPYRRIHIAGDTIGCTILGRLVSKARRRA